MNIAQLAFQAIWSPSAGPPPLDTGSKLPTGAAIEGAFPRPEAPGGEKLDFRIKREDGLPAYGPKVALSLPFVVPPVTTAVVEVVEPAPQGNTGQVVAQTSGQDLQRGVPELPKPHSGIVPGPVPAPTSGPQLGRPDVPSPTSTGGQGPVPDTTSGPQLGRPEVPQPTSQALQKGRPDVPNPTSSGTQGGVPRTRNEGTTPVPVTTSGLQLGRPEVPQATSQGLQKGVPNVPKPHSGGASDSLPVPNSDTRQAPVPIPTSGGLQEGRPDIPELTSQRLQRGVPDLPSVASDGAPVPKPHTEAGQGTQPVPTSHVFQLGRPETTQKSSQKPLLGAPDAPKAHSSNGADAVPVTTSGGPQLGRPATPVPTSLRVQHGVPDAPSTDSVQATLLPLLASLGQRVDRADLPQPTSFDENGHPLPANQGLQKGVPDLPSLTSRSGNPGATPATTSGPQLGRPGPPQANSQGAEEGVPDLPTATSRSGNPGATLAPNSGLQMGRPDAPQPNSQQGQGAPKPTSDQAVAAPPVTQTGQAADIRVVSNPGVVVPNPTSGATLGSDALEAITGEGTKAKAKAREGHDTLLEKKPSAVSQQHSQIEVPATRTLTPVTVKETVHLVREALENLVGSAGIHTAVVTLADEALGEVRIKVTSRGKRVDAEIAASDEAVRTLLRTHRQEFELAVTQKGFELGSFHTGREGSPPERAESPTTGVPTRSSRDADATPVSASRLAAADSGLDVVI